MHVDSQMPRFSHPIIFLLLILPFGIVSGNLTVTLAYTLSQAGVTTTLIAELIAGANL